MARHEKRIRSALVAAVIIGSVLGTVGTSWAVRSSFSLQIMIGGGFSLPMGTTGDGTITLRLGRDLPVFLVTDGTVVPGPVGTATVVQWIDSTPSTGFGELADLIVIRAGGGLMLMAAGIATVGGPVTTFSSTPPFETVSGTWTMTGGIGSEVSGAGAGDLVVTIFPNLNTENTIAGFATFVAGGALAEQTSKAVPGLGSIALLHNIHVFAVVNNAVGTQVGTLTGYTAGQGFEFGGLTAINFGSVFLLYGCAFPGTGGIACLAGGTGPVAQLSGTVSQTAGMFRKDIAGVTDADLVLRLTGSLPQSGD